MVVHHAPCGNGAGVSAVNEEDPPSLHVLLYSTEAIGNPHLMRLTLQAWPLDAEQCNALADYLRVCALHFLQANEIISGPALDADPIPNGTKLN